MFHHLYCSCANLFCMLPGYLDCNKHVIKSVAILQSMILQNYLSRYKYIKNCLQFLEQT